MDIGIECWAVHAIDLLPPCLWKVKKSEVKSEVKCSVSNFFWSFNFFILRYVKGGVLGNNNIGIKKCTTTFLWVLNLGQVGEILENFQNHPLGESFWKIFSKVWFWRKKKSSFFTGKSLVNFFQNHTLETIFQKSHRSSVILKILGSTPQLVSNFTPTRKLLGTFLYLCYCYP